MIGQLLTAGFYAAVAMAVIAVNWHRKTRYAGVALLGYTVVSSATFFLMREFEWVVLREIGLATLMSILAFELWLSGDAPRTHQAVMALCALDATFCGAICFYNDTSFHARTLFAYGVNIIYVAMCVAVAAPGVRDAVRGWLHSIDTERGRDITSPDLYWLAERGWGEDQ